MTDTAAENNHGKCFVQGLTVRLWRFDFEDWVILGTGRGVFSLFWKEPLLISVMVSVIIGVLTGGLLRGSSLSARDIELIGKEL